MARMSTPRRRLSLSFTTIPKYLLSLFLSLFLSFSFLFFLSFSFSLFLFLSSLSFFYFLAFSLLLSLRLVFVRRRRCLSGSQLGRDHHAKIERGRTPLRSLYDHALAPGCSVSNSPGFEAFVGDLRNAFIRTINIRFGPSLHMYGRSKFGPSHKSIALRAPAPPFPASPRSRSTPAVFLSPHATPCALGFVSDPAQLKFTPLRTVSGRRGPTRLCVAGKIRSP